MSDSRQMFVSDETSDAFHNLCRVYGTDIVEFVTHFAHDGEWSDLPPGLGSLKGLTGLRASFSTIVILMNHAEREMRNSPVSVSD